MKNKLSALCLIALCAFSSCSNGDYQASPTSPANNSINPLNQLKAEDFNWKGTDPVSLEINGVKWVADAAYVGMDTTGAHYLVATKGKNTLYIYMKDSWGGNLYTLANKNEKRWAYWIDSSAKSPMIYYSDIGNSGQLMMKANDTAYAKGLFHFKGVSPFENKVINITNGWFNVHK